MCASCIAFCCSALLGTWHVRPGLCESSCVPVARVGPSLVLACCVSSWWLTGLAPWHLARLGTWLALALGTPWHLARDRCDRASVESACASRRLVVCARCACSPCLSFCSCVSDASVFGWPPWHLARPGTWHACGAVLAQMLCRHTCIAGTHALQHTLGRCMWCCGLVPIPARAGMGWIPPLNGCSQGLVVRGVAPCTLSYICHTKVFSKVSNSLPIHQYFPTASPYGAQSGGWIGMTD